MKHAHPRSRRARAALATATAVLLGVGLVGCGDSEASDREGAARNEQGQNEQGQAPEGRRAEMPGASGKVAAVSGSTAQVQGESGQVAVSWTDATEITQQSAASLADVEVGACVVVSAGAEEPEDSEDSEESGAGAASAQVRAETVQIASATDDGCGLGGPGGGPKGGPEAPDGARPEPPAGDAGERPERPEAGDDAERERPEGGPGRLVIGEVSAVSASGFTLSTTQLGPPPSGDGTDGSAEAGDSSSRQEQEQVEVTVLVDEETTYTAEVAATADAIEVGRCLTAEGERDETGALTAETIRVSDAVDGQCRPGFGAGAPPQGGPERGADEADQGASE